MNYIKKIALSGTAGLGGALLIAMPASALVQTADIATGAVTSAKIADHNVTMADLAGNSVGSTQIGTGSVSNSEIRDGSVSSAKILGGAVTGNKLASDISITTTGTLNAAGLTLTGSLVQKAGTIVSGTALPLSGTAGNVFTVTGNTTVTSATVAAGDAGRTVTLVFTGTPTITDGSNLKLHGDLNAGADDTITLVSNGTNWYEVSRSDN